MFDPGDWIYRYYVYPIIYDTSYNPVDTVTWAIILGMAILGLMRLFQQMNLQIDERLVVSTLPYILAGSCLRVVEDADLIPPPWRYLLISPLIFFLVALMTVACLLITRRIMGEEYHRSYALLGLVWAVLDLIILSTTGFEMVWVIAAVFLLGTTITAGIVLVSGRAFSLNFLNDRFNLMIVYAHMLDASSTYIGVDWFGYYEKHVVPTLLIDLTGSAAVMFPLKILILLPILFMIDQSLQDPSLRNLTKLTLITLGLAPAVRNTIRLALGI